jgi:hypothetical protein
MKATHLPRIVPMGTMCLPHIGYFDIEYIYPEPKRFDYFLVRIDFHTGKPEILTGAKAFEDWLEQRQ